MALHDARAHAQDDALHPRPFGLLRYREQRLLERQPSAHERCELAREERKVRRRAAPAPAKGALLLGLGLRDLGYGDGEELALAQQLANVARCVALENALALAPAWLQGGVLKRPHGGKTSPRA